MFRKIAKSDCQLCRSCLYARLSSRNNSYSTGQIYMTFGFFDDCLTVHRRWHEESKTNSTLQKGLLELMNRSTCFGHYYAHLQELATIQMVSAYASSPWLWQVVKYLSNRTLQILQPCTRPATCHNQGEEPYAETICTVASSWRWA